MIIKRLFNFGMHHMSNEHTFILNICVMFNWMGLPNFIQKLRLIFMKDLILWRQFFYMVVWFPMSKGFLEGFKTILVGFLNMATYSIYEKKFSNSNFERWQRKVQRLRISPRRFSKWIRIMESYVFSSLPVWRLANNHTWCHPRCHVCPGLRKWTRCMERAVVHPYVRNFITN